ncbi:hypothetical protein FKW77_010919 [Venturia effusa]|uniref:DUF2293 domain-containing protein n=1 Tax=Venturia effusa TaxID=50376 RepID=A0A517KYU0_9PEZI|nr:hypothetical protein FKW77_010919 [Venturia effusa]
MPKGYVFVRKGNVYLTAKCRKKTHGAGKPLFVVQDERKRALGIRVPRAIFTSVFASHQNTKAARQAAVAAKEGRLSHKAKECIEATFPQIPRELISDILNHTLKKGSGRVGRTATIPLEETIDLAVRAFIRHRLTEYDDLLRDGMEHKRARQTIRSKVEKVVEEWKTVTNRPSKPESTRTKPQSRTVLRKRAEGALTAIDIDMEVIDLTND